MAEEVSTATDSWQEVIPRYPGNKHVSVQNDESNSYNVWARHGITTQYIEIPPGKGTEFRQEEAVLGIEIKNEDKAADNGVTSQEVHVVYEAKNVVC